MANLIGPNITDLVCRVLDSQSHKEGFLQKEEKRGIGEGNGFFTSIYEAGKWKRTCLIFRTSSVYGIRSRSRQKRALGPPSVSL